MTEHGKTAIVVGSGAGGLATAIRLLSLGFQVTVFDALPHPGGKMRAVDSDAGPIDAGPTVLTMIEEVSDLFSVLNEKISDHLILDREPIVARHFWRDGSSLDLFSDPVKSAAAIRTFAGPVEAQAFGAYRKRAQRLFDGFRAPVMSSANPGPLGSAKAVVQNPRLLLDIAPTKTLDRLLSSTFQDPRLRQLFGRYATYVGGSPYAAPALLSLIWRSEEAGVWRVKGGMHGLAKALAALAARHGAVFQFGQKVQSLNVAQGQMKGVTLANGGKQVADVVVFNGDPKALTDGMLGPDATQSVDAKPLKDRSLSANVLSFAAHWTGPELLHHNVFFTEDPREEFDPIAQGHAPKSATLYVCAQDRGAHRPTPNAAERFEIIENAAPIGHSKSEDSSQCLNRLQMSLQSFGVQLGPQPGLSALTQPQDFAQMFPGSQGSLYGQSPHGMTAAFKRPTARTKVPGLYLTGGGCHPGAGVPMAMLSGRHAVDTIMKDLRLTLTSQATDTPGGTSTAFPIAGNMQSQSSPS